MNKSFKLFVSQFGTLIVTFLDSDSDTDFNIDEIQSSEYYDLSGKGNTWLTSFLSNDRAIIINEKKVNFNSKDVKVTVDSRIDRESPAFLIRESV